MWTDWLPDSLRKVIFAWFPSVRRENDWRFIERVIARGSMYAELKNLATGEMEYVQIWPVSELAKEGDEVTDESPLDTRLGIPDGAGDSGDGEGLSPGGGTQGCLSGILHDLPAGSGELRDPSGSNGEAA